MTLTIVRGDAHALPLANASVDLVVTSPPYFGLRDYRDGDASLAGQIGTEVDPREYLDALVACTREWLRVVKPSGSIVVNLGDKFAGSGGGGGGSSDGRTGRASRPARRGGFAPTKSLMGLPWRYALACVDDLGLILRQEVIWSKPNGLPESVTDRARRSHEQWFHLTRGPRYYSCMDRVRDPYTAPPFRGQKHHNAGDSGATRNPVLTSVTSWDASAYEHNPLGKLPGSVRSVPTGGGADVPKDLGAHFAAFPVEWPRWWIQMLCPAAGVVLDPFSGTGTTAQVAHALGCHGVGVDLSDTYCRIGADERVVARRAARVKNTPTPLTANPTQGDLLDLFTEAV